MTLLLAIDPGAKPGYALLDTSTLVPRKYVQGRPALPVVLGLWGKFPELQRAPDIVVSELQWLTGPEVLQRKRSILTLAPRMGWQLCRACLTLGAKPHAQTPQQWRATLGVQPRVTKGVVARRIELSLTPAELALVAATRLPPGRLLDLYDAIAIGWADWLQPRPWEIPP
jgi:hypothetical protein